VELFFDTRENLFEPKPEPGVLAARTLRCSVLMLREKDPSSDRLMIWRSTSRWWVVDLEVEPAEQVRQRVLVVHRPVVADVEAVLLLHDLPRCGSGCPAARPAPSATTAAR
jgi:hypothetical protein